MRFGIISDIHGNLVALKAVMHGLERAGYDQLICLGDVVGYGPDPAACLDFVREHDAIMVRGNHEEALCQPAVARCFNDNARIAIEWTRNRMISERPELLREVSRFSGMAYIGNRIMCVHDTPSPSGTTYLTNGHAAAHAFSGVDASICLVGHTHVPICFRAPRNSDGRLGVHASQVETMSPDGESTIELDAQSRWIINPGSVGQPRDGDVRASAAVLDLGKASLSWLRMEYDIAEAQHRAEAVGLPSSSALRLSIGA